MCPQFSSLTITMDREVEISADVAATLGLLVHYCACAALHKTKCTVGKFCSAFLTYYFHSWHFNIMIVCSPGRYWHLLQISVAVEELLLGCFLLLICWFSLTTSLEVCDFFPEICKFRLQVGKKKTNDQSSQTWETIKFGHLATHSFSFFYLVSLVCNVLHFLDKCWGEEWNLCPRNKLKLPGLSGN